MDPKKIVAHGYDRIAERYAEWAPTVREEEREHYTRVMLDSLPERAAVLELGCGNGLPTTKRLVERFEVTAVDISGRQIALARQNVPEATFVHADMTTLEFPPASFDGVAAFYAIIHVPREEHEPLLGSIVRSLRPGGPLVATLGARSWTGEVEEDWLGTPMYFSHFDAETNRALVERAGLRLEGARVEIADEDGVSIPFLWIVARKPRLGGASGEEGSQPD
ncbi:MAG: class I SAM-dependent methyltransferase [Thermomicrobiales bacterium]